MALSRKARTYTLPVAMLVGIIFNDFFAKLSALPPYLIAVMLFVTFTTVSVKDMKLRPLHWILLSIQLLGSIAVFLIISGFNEILAQGMMICVFAPVAISAVVIAVMLGANVNTMATFGLLSNMSVAVVAPVVFSFIGTHTEMPFLESAFVILSKVGPLLILPFAGAWILERFVPKLHSAIRSRQSISFWLWAVSLTIVMGRTVKFILAQSKENYWTEILLAAGALVVCLVQFGLGRYFGGRYGDKPAGGQSLGQKNTILAIWMAQSYLDPLSSIAPAMYVVWQNVVNSWQLWRYKEQASPEEMPVED